MQTRRSRYFPLALFGWTFWLPMAFAGTLLGGTLLVIPGGWPLAGLAGIVTIAGLLFFRDPIRRVPTDRAIMVAPADGKVTEITYLEHYEPLGASQGSVLRIGIFLSVLDVHINRDPCDAVVVATTYQEGLFLDARHPDSGPKNQSHTLVLGSTEAGDHHPIAVVKQIVGAIAPADHRAGACRPALLPRRAFWHDCFRQPDGALCAPPGSVGGRGPHRPTRQGRRSVLLRPKE